MDCFPTEKTGMMHSLNTFAGTAMHGLSVGVAFLKAYALMYNLSIDQSRGPGALRALIALLLATVCTNSQLHDDITDSQHGVLLQEDTAVSMGGAADTVSAEVERIYGALLHGPKQQAPTEGMRLPLRTPQGTKAFSEAIHALLEGHVEYIHQAHHHLMPVRRSELSGTTLGTLVF